MISAMPPLPANWTQCPICRYELRGIVAEATGRFRCPECGRSWSIPQLHDFARGKFHWGTMPYWLPVPPLLMVLLIVAMRLAHNPSSGMDVIVLGAASAIFYWVWWMIIIARNAKRKLDEFAYVVGGMLGLIPAAISTYAACYLGLIVGFALGELVTP